MRVSCRKCGYAYHVHCDMVGYLRGARMRGIEVDVFPHHAKAILKFGCVSHACRFNKPKGMGTNSGKCYCLTNLTTMQESAILKVMEQVFVQLKEGYDETN